MLFLWLPMLQGHTEMNKTLVEGYFHGIYKSHDSNTSTMQALPLFS